MKKLLFVALLATLSACTPSTNSIDGAFVKPPELQDCKFYDMRSNNGISYMVVRCPNSSTSTTYGGKHKKQIIVVDGKEFVEK